MTCLFVILSLSKYLKQATERTLDLRLAMTRGIWSAHRFCHLEERSDERPFRFSIFNIDCKSQHKFYSRLSALCALISLCGNVSLHFFFKFYKKTVCASEILPTGQLVTMHKCGKKSFQIITISFFIILIYNKID